MRFSPSEKELAEIPAMDEDERLHYFLSRAIECEEVWSLGSDYGWTIREEEDQRIIPVWPYQELATICACGECAKQRPDAVSLEHFLYRVLTMMKDNGIQVEVLPSVERPGVLMAAEALFNILQDRMDSREPLLEG